MKPPYKKSNAVRELEILAMDEARRKHPTMPHLAPRLYRDDSVNNLTRCIIDYLRLKGHQTERISVMGRYVDGTKVVKDCIGNTYKIGSGKWIPGSMQKGSADISAIVNGNPWKIEIKIGKDRQSKDQKLYERQVKDAGGYYSIIKSFEDFLNHYKLLLNN